MTGASPWSVKGIAAEERELAKQAARRAGVPIGQWLSRQIRDAADQERASRGAARGAPADPRFGGHGNWQGGDQASGHGAAGHGGPGQTAAAWRSVLTAPPPAPEIPHPPPAPYSHPPAVAPAPRPAPPSIDPARLREVERQVAELRGVEGRVEALEKLERRIAGLAGELRELGSRLDGVESHVDSQAASTQRELRELSARLEDLPAVAGVDSTASVTASTAPIERAVMRLAERLQRVEELTLPDERSGRGLLARLFRR